MSYHNAHLIDMKNNFVADTLSSLDRYFISLIGMHQNVYDQQCLVICYIIIGQISTSAVEYVAFWSTYFDYRNTQLLSNVDTL